MNPILARQLRRLGLDPSAPPSDESKWTEFLAAVERYYDEADRNRYLTERSLQISAQEMRELWDEHRMNSEAAAARSERHYSNLFEESPIPTWEEDFSDVATWLDDLRAAGVTDLEAHFADHPEEIEQGIRKIDVTDLNPAALAFLEVTDKSGVIGRMDTSRYNEDSLQSYRSQFVAMWNGIPSTSYEITGQRASGERLDAILHWSAPYADGVFDFSKVIVAMVDISERIQAMERMEELIRSKDEFIASVSHELRTPLTTVYGSAEALLEQWAELDSELRLELVEFIARESGELAHIVEDLLVAARADIGLRFAPQQLAIAPLVTATVESTKRNAAGKTIDTCELGGEVYADPLRLKQIMRNLLTNAVRYGGPSIRVQAASHADRVWIIVLDDGEGVPPESRESMFELYQRAHDDVGQVGSVGVGLAVSRQLAEDMGGTLEYDHAGGWSRFRLELPARPPSLESFVPVAAAAS